MHAGISAASVSPEADEIAVHLADGSVVTAERLLVAAGRRADPAAVGLDAVGAEPGARFAAVAERCRVSDGVWAVGDITGKGAFTHVAMYQPGFVIRDLLDEPGPLASYSALPRVTFTDPEVGAVGLIEAQARKTLTSVRIGIADVPSTAGGWIHKIGNEGVIKLVEDAARGVLVGATAIGPARGEALGAFAVAVHAEIPVQRLRSMIYAYPTFHQGIEDALSGLQ